MNLDFQTVTAQYVDFIENYLKDQCFCYNDEPQQNLFKAMRYSLLAGGKHRKPSGSRHAGH